MNFEVLGAFALATAALSLSPGPDNIFVLVQSLAHGAKSGFATIAGLMTGCLVHTTLLALGISTLIKESDSVFLGIKFFGSAYLLFLAYKVLRSEAAISLGETNTLRTSLGKLFKTGFFMNVLNPKVTIFFLAFFPGFLFSQTLTAPVQFYILGFMFIAVSSLVFGSIALLAGKISDYLSKSKSLGHWLKWMQIVVFVSIAVYLLFSKG